MGQSSVGFNPVFAAIQVKTFTDEEMLFPLLKGHRPTETERELLRAVVVSHISHGITAQSTLAVVQAADCRSDFLNAAIGVCTSLPATPYLVVG